MIILGIDPGSNTTGYGVLECRANRFQVIEAGPIRLRRKESIGERLWALSREVEALLLKHKPDSISLEKVFHGVNFNATLHLGYVRGAILLLAAKHAVPLAEYASTEVKKSVTGYGRADKAQVAEMVRILLNLREPPKPHDVSDALALAICHAHLSPTLARYKT